MKIALDATYSLGSNLSGVGLYSRELLFGLAALRPQEEWRWLYRPHRFRRSFAQPVPFNVNRGLLLEHVATRQSRLFHGLNQRLPRTPFTYQVATFHDLFVMTAEYSTASFRARFSTQARQAARTADHVIAVSHFTASQVTELLGVEPSRVSVIPHGVRRLPQWNVPREKIVLHVGAIQKRKNLTRLVRAFEAVPSDWRLVLAGSDGYGAAEVREAAERSSAAARITIAGYVNDEDLGGWYSRASVLAFPSLDEGFGMPVLEAMAAGLPVVASRTSAVGEVAGSAALLIDPEDEDELAARLNDVIQDQRLRERLVRAGYERAAQFTWRQASLGTLAVYERLLGR